MKKTWAKFKEVFYIVTILGILTGWISTNRITKAQNVMENQIRDAKIESLVNENKELKLSTTKNKDYVEENANNIVWIVRILELDSE